MRLGKRRGQLNRPVGKPDTILIFQNSLRNWRDRVKALKAAQDAGQGKEDAGFPKPERP